MAATTTTEIPRGGRRTETAYQAWMEAQGIPIHRGYYVSDLRTAEVGWWEMRGCHSAFLELAGQENIQESRVTEVRPGTTIPPSKIAVEEMVYVVEGRGLCSVWGAEGLPKKTFEFQKHSLFMIPPNYTYQVSSTQGNQAVRLLQVNYLPLGMLLNPNADFFVKNDYVDLSLVYGEDESPYSEAKMALRSEEEAGDRGVRALWVGNFFPDMARWDKLEAHRRRGGGGSVIDFRSKTGRGGHMSVFPVGTYKRAHRHGPGTVIVIPDGEGYSILWQEGGEKIIVPWQEASVFVPPNQWYHQHFNRGAVPARYLAIARPGNILDTDESLDERQIDYTREEPWIREKFEEEMRHHGVKSLMPDEAYQVKDYQWKYREDGK
jgi:oxalate decarboxylase/phosphoglucose isomerase-like protein (cupin superfamily)